MERIEFDKVLDTHYRDNWDILLKKYTWVLQSRAKAEDAIQEAYRRAIDYHLTLDEAERFHPWFITILHNAIKDIHRTDAMHGMTDNIEGLDIPIRPAAIPAVTYKQVVERIQEKDPHIKRILSLFLIYHYRPKEISQVVPENANAIRQIVHRFREEIRKDFNWAL